MLEERYSLIGKASRESRATSSRQFFAARVRVVLRFTNPRKMEKYAQTKTLPDDSLLSITAVSIWLFTSHGTPSQ